ncbi:hypothetical protein E2C06_30825 [Dankookia rubra]|uniref:Chloramphenicol phosphotransferase n=1 Tax=Dankookia rubra TaxID=1442381 RepID=A0A4R5Q8C6_9PROT|nr:hypothetical protein [Dankookia rubra]TDH58759.1 hypothetical protein E2C06_30825 [Dankookia rubra]
MDRELDMGVIVNPRGTSGAGKTEFAPRILADYGWGKDGQVEPIHHSRRRWPVGYRLRHPLGRRPLIVLGHYERTSGGCDTFSARDGGLDEAFRLADAWASAEHDVLLEGFALSTEHERSAWLARRHALHVLCLATPPEQAARNLVSRWRARGDSWPSVTGAVVTQRDAIEDACSRLQHVATVEDLGFEAALCRARQVLALPPEAG